MSTTKAHQHVYFCQFTALGYDDPGMAAFDNANSVLDFAMELRKQGYYVEKIFKLGILTSVEEALEELGWEIDGN